MNVLGKYADEMYSALHSITSRQNGEVYRFPIQEGIKEACENLLKHNHLGTLPYLLQFRNYGYLVAILTTFS